MPFIDSWDVFFQRAEDLYRAEPLRTRFVTKYRHCDGKLEFKVTDDRKCLKFKTDQAQDLKRLEKLNQLFFTISVYGEQAEVADHLPEAAPPTPAQGKTKDARTSSQAQGGQQNQSQGSKGKRGRKGQ